MEDGRKIHFPYGRGRRSPGHRCRCMLAVRAVMFAVVLAAAALTAAGCTRRTGTEGPVGGSGQGPTEKPTINPFPQDGAGLSSAGEEAAGQGGSGSEPGREPSQDSSPVIGSTEEEPWELPGQEPGYDWTANVIIATDIHYLAGSLTDGGPRFRQMVEHGDGKVVTYIGQITDAFLDEVIRLQPEALVLSGDLTLDGEKESHEELAQKLYRVEDAGITVLVIPGNHDINNRRAARFEGTERLPAEFTTPEEFREIYRDFGYDEALKKDRFSLSYVYELDSELRLLMLDTCQYNPIARVGGAILTDTYDWIGGELEEAWNDEIFVIPVAHHNLLDESEIYVDDCTIEHSEQLVEKLEEWDVPLFLSGHLHVQHTKQSEGDWGIQEMVTSSLATPSCKYGILTFRSDGSFYYRTRPVDVEGWAAREGRTEADLINFNKFREPFLRQVFYNQSYDALKESAELSEDQKMRMSALYSEVNYHYYQGTANRIRAKALADPDYALWMEEGAISELSEYLQYILEDAVRDYNQVSE